MSESTPTAMPTLQIGSPQTEALTLLIEECAEVIQAVSKIQRFGHSTTNIKTGVKNCTALTKELADLYAVLHLIEEHQVVDLPDQTMIKQAITRKKKYSSL